MKTKKNLGFMVGLALLFFSASLLQAEKKTSLAFNSVFLAAEGNPLHLETGNESPGILFLTKISGRSLGKNPDELAQNLSDIFRLPRLDVKNVSEETVISWESWKERKGGPRA